MLLIFFNSQSLVHTEFVTEGKPVNAEFYKGVMDRLLKRIQRVRPAASRSRNFFLLQDNASAQKAASFCQFSTLSPNPLKKNITTLHHLQYSSPDLSPPDYFLFLKLKMKLKALHFADVA